MFSREEVARACRSWGSMLSVPPGIEGPRLLWALAGCESSFGANCKPRHEPFYHDLAAKGTNAQLVAMTAKWGCDAHSSFGPWQELLINCSASMQPEDFATLARCGLEVAQFLNRYVLGQRHADTVLRIAETYNSGKWQWLKVPPGVAHYGAECVHFYENEPMPVNTAAAQMAGGVHV
jgi:hypothetical protein